jgi:hypothetical protein
VEDRIVQLVGVWTLFAGEVGDEPARVERDRSVVTSQGIGITLRPGSARRRFGSGDVLSQRCCADALGEPLEEVGVRAASIEVLRHWHCGLSTMTRLHHRHDMGAAVEETVPNCTPPIRWSPSRRALTGNAAL